MAKKYKEVRDPIYQGGRFLDELVVIAPKINTKAKKGTWEYVKAVAKNRKQIAYTRVPFTGKKSSDIVVTDSNGQNSYFTDPVDGELVRRGQYTYRSNAKDNSFVSGLQNFLNTTTAGAMDLASYVPYAAGKALDAVGSPVGKDLIRTSEDLELDARRINRYEVAPADFWSASTLGSFLPSLGLAAVTGGKSLALDANTSRAYTKHITKDLGGSPLLSNTLGAVAGAATALPIGGATLQGATKQALSQYLKSAATRAALNTGIGVGTVAAPQLFTGDYEGALNTATTIAPIIAGSSIVSSGLPKAAAYKGYDALTEKYLKGLRGSRELWADKRQKLPFFIPKKWADRAKMLTDDFYDSIYDSDETFASPSHRRFSVENLQNGVFDSPGRIPYRNLISENMTPPTSIIIPEVADLVERELASRINAYMDPAYTSPKRSILEEAIQQSQRLTGKKIDVKNVPQAQGEYRGTAIRDAYLSTVLKGIYDPSVPEVGTTGHYLKNTNPAEYNKLISERALDDNRIEQKRPNRPIFTPMIKDGVLYDSNPNDSNYTFRYFYPNSLGGLADPITENALLREKSLGVLFNSPKWDLRAPAALSLTPFSNRKVLDLIFRKGAEKMRGINDELNRVQQSADEASLIHKIKEEYDKEIPEGAEKLKIHKVDGVSTPKQAHKLFEDLPTEILSMLGLDLKDVAAKDVPLHTRAIHGWESVKDMLDTGVMSSKFGETWKGVSGEQAGTAFVQGRKKLDPVPLFGTDLENATPISQRTSPDHDLRAGRTSHYVEFNGRRNGGLGGNLVAVANPNAMIEALGGEYYLLGKPHGIEFSHESKYSPSSSLVGPYKQGLYIDSRNTFERIANMDDYISLSKRLPHIGGATANHSNVRTIHRTVGRELREDELKALHELGARSDALRRGYKGKAPIVPIAPPIEAYSLIEYVNPVEGLYSWDIRDHVATLNGLGNELSRARYLMGPDPNPLQAAIDDKKAMGEAAKYASLRKRLMGWENPKANAESGLYILPYKEMKKVKDARSAKDPDYGYMYTGPKDGKKIRHSRQL